MILSFAKRGLLLFLGAVLPTLLVVSQTGTTQVQCDRAASGTLVCQRRQTLLYGLLSRPPDSFQLLDARLEAQQRSANNNDRTYTFYQIYLETDRGSVLLDSTRDDAARAEAQLQQIQAFIREGDSFFHEQGGLERTIAATVAAIVCVAGAVLVGSKLRGT